MGSLEGALPSMSKGPAAPAGGLFLGKMGSLGEMEEWGGNGLNWGSMAYELVNGWGRDKL